MAAKIKLTRPELKRYRDALDRYRRYLPMLKLKQQQLQSMQREVARQRAEAEASLQAAVDVFRAYEMVLADLAGLPIRQWAEPQEVRTSTTNVAGVNVPVFEEAVFPKTSYSLFGTPAWVDQALADLREINRRQARLDVIDEQYVLLSRHLARTIQRVNLFEKVKIPEAQEAIRVIRIRLGDEMTAAVGRAKMAKSKLARAKWCQIGDSEPEDAGDVVSQKPAGQEGPGS